MNRSFDDKLNTIKWLGILTMTIDHIGYFLFPGLIWMRMIGRIAFPCFLYSTIEGTRRTSNYRRYILRLFLLGALSMPVTPNTINVLFLLGLFSLSMKYRKYSLIFMMLSIFAEYSIYGFLFGWAIYWMKKEHMLQGIACSVLIQFLFGMSIQFLSILALPFFFLKKGIKLPHLPRYFFYWFYPIHHAVLLVIAAYVI